MKNNKILTMKDADGKITSRAYLRFMLLEPNDLGRLYLDGYILGLKNVVPKSESAVEVVESLGYIVKDDEYLKGFDYSDYGKSGNSIRVTDGEIEMNTEVYNKNGISFEKDLSKVKELAMEMENDIYSILKEYLIEEDAKDVISLYYHILENKDAFKK